MWQRHMISVQLGLGFVTGDFITDGLSSLCINTDPH
jgi:hypothetical protein